MGQENQREKRISEYFDKYEVPVNKREAIRSKLRTFTDFSDPEKIVLKIAEEYDLTLPSFKGVPKTRLNTSLMEPSFSDTHRAGYIHDAINSGRGSMMEGANENEEKEALDYTWNELSEIEERNLRDLELSIVTSAERLQLVTLMQVAMKKNIVQIYSRKMKKNKKRPRKRKKKRKKVDETRDVFFDTSEISNRFPFDSSDVSFNGYDKMGDGLDPLVSDKALNERDEFMHDMNEKMEIINTAIVPIDPLMQPKADNERNEFLNDCREKMEIIERRLLEERDRKDELKEKWKMLPGLVMKNKELKDPNEIDSFFDGLKNERDDVLSEGELKRIEDDVVAEESFLKDMNSLVDETSVIVQSDDGKEEEVMEILGKEEFDDPKEIMAEEESPREDGLGFLLEDIELSEGEEKEEEGEEKEEEGEEKEEEGEKKEEEGEKEVSLFEATPQHEMIVEELNEKENDEERRKEFDSITSNIDGLIESTEDDNNEVNDIVAQLKKNYDEIQKIEAEADKNFHNPPEEPVVITGWGSSNENLFEDQLSEYARSKNLSEEEEIATPSAVEGGVTSMGSAAGDIFQPNEAAVANMTENNGSVPAVNIEEDEETEEEFIDELPEVYPESDENEGTLIQEDVFTAESTPREIPNVRVPSTLPTLNEILSEESELKARVNEILSNSKVHKDQPIFIDEKEFSSELKPDYDVPLKPETVDEIENGHKEEIADDERRRVERLEKEMSKNSPIFDQEQPNIYKQPINDDEGAAGNLLKVVRNIESELGRMGVESSEMKENITNLLNKKNEEIAAFQGTSPSFKNRSPVVENPVSYKQRIPSKSYDPVMEVPVSYNQRKPTKSFDNRMEVPISYNQPKSYDNRAPLEVPISYNQPKRSMKSYDDRAPLEVPISYNQPKRSMKSYDNRAPLEVPISYNQRKFSMRSYEKRDAMMEVPVSYSNPVSEAPTPSITSSAGRVTTVHEDDFDTIRLEEEILLCQKRLERNELEIDLFTNRISELGMEKQILVFQFRKLNAKLSSNQRNSILSSVDEIKTSMSAKEKSLEKLNERRKKLHSRLNRLQDELRRKRKIKTSLVKQSVEDKDMQVQFNQRIPHQYSSAASLEGFEQPLKEIDKRKKVEELRKLRQELDDELSRSRKMNNEYDDNDEYFDEEEGEYYDSQGSFEIEYPDSGSLEVNDAGEIYGASRSVQRSYSPNLQASHRLSDILERGLSNQISDFPRDYVKKVTESDSSKVLEESVYHDDDEDLFNDQFEEEELFNSKPDYRRRNVISAEELEKRANEDLGFNKLKTPEERKRELEVLDVIRKHEETPVRMSQSDLLRTPNSRILDMSQRGVDIPTPLTLFSQQLDRDEMLSKDQIDLRKKLSEMQMIVKSMEWQSI